MLLAVWADDPSGLGQPVGLQRVVRTTFWTKYSIVLEVPFSSLVKKKFGRQNFGYQIFFLLYNVFKNMFNMSLMIMW